MLTGRVWRYCLLCCCLLLSACVQLPSPAQRQLAAQNLLEAQGWHWMQLDSGDFSLFAAMDTTAPHAEEITIYLEGDGLAWLNQDTPSDDPTPLDPVALRLALRQPDGHAVYLARPCQYLAQQREHCSQALWTEARFSPAVVAALDGAVTQLKARFAARRINLVGYSGGAALAMLLAERRDDVRLLVSVAGNIDPSAWVRLHGLSPLRASLDPLADIGSLHAERLFLLSGADDQNIPPQLADGVVAALNGRLPAISHSIDGFNHHCCWETDWPRLWGEAQAVR